MPSPTPLTAALLVSLAATPALGSPSPEAAHRLDTVTVTARLPEDPRRRAEAVARLDAAAVDRLAPTHANEALARVPGAWASRGSGQEQLLALRSPVLTGPGACGAFLVLDDGVPIRPAGFCNVNQLSELNLAQAGRVEVLRGPGSAVHGSNALHGVVAVQPRRPGDGDTLRLETGSDAFRRLQVGLDRPHARLDAHRTEAGSSRADEGYRLVQATAQWQARDDTRLALSTHRLDQETAGFVVGDGAWRDARRRSNANPEAFRDARATRLVLHHEQTVGDATLLGIGGSTALSMQSVGQPEVAQGPCTARFGGPAAGLGAGRVVAVRFRPPFRAHPRQGAEHSPAGALPHRALSPIWPRAPDALPTGPHTATAGGPR
ncbi:MAG: TonB-dependent receptor plug domain-containing protein, partial [Pseudomonadota bacterium]